MTKHSFPPRQSRRWGAVGGPHRACRRMQPMTIRYRHHPDRSIAPDAAPTEGEVDNLAELEALVLLGSVGPDDEVALDGKRFKRATRIPELRQSLEGQHGVEGGFWGNALLLLGTGLAALIALGVLFSLASSLFKVACVVALIAGAVWVWRRFSARGQRRAAAIERAARR